MRSVVGEMKNMSKMKGGKGERDGFAKGERKFTRGMEIKIVKHAEK